MHNTLYSELKSAKVCLGPRALVRAPGQYGARAPRLSGLYGIEVRNETRPGFINYLIIVFHPSLFTPPSFFLIILDANQTALNR